jgi:hypothetical protein
MKYGNKKKEVDGILFDSTREALRYSELMLLIKRGDIGSLEVQKQFILVPSQKLSNGKTERAVKYIADFVYTSDGIQVCEDVKGFKTKDYIIKRKLMKFIYNIEVLET